MIRLRTIIAAIIAACIAVLLGIIVNSVSASIFSRATPSSPAIVADPNADLTYQLRQAGFTLAGTDSVRECSTSGSCQDVTHAQSWERPDATIDLTDKLYAPGTFRIGVIRLTTLTRIRDEVFTQTWCRPSNGHSGVGKTVTDAIAIRDGIVSGALSLRSDYPGSYEVKTPIGTCSVAARLFNRKM